MSSQLNEFQNATVGMVVGVIEVRHRLIACDRHLLRAACLFTLVVPTKPPFP